MELTVHETWLLSRFVKAVEDACREFEVSISGYSIVVAGQSVATRFHFDSAGAGSIGCD